MKRFIRKRHFPSKTTKEKVTKQQAYSEWLKEFPTREDCPEMTDKEYSTWRNFEEYAFFCQ